MRTRTSIELHPTGSRLVEVEVSPARRAAADVDVRARYFTNDLPPSTDTAALTARLSAIRLQHKVSKNVWVTIWGLKTAHHFLRLPPAKPAALEGLAAREARKDIAALEADGDRASVGILIGAEVQVGSHRRREVSLVAVPGGEVRRRIHPIVDAGFVVDGVLTPALGLTAVARSYRESVPPGSAATYVALTAHATCVAIVRDGLLLFAREMSWGYEPRDQADGHAKDVEATVAARLASELRRSVLFFKQTFRSPVEQVVLCGDMPNLRALTAPLGEALAMPVKTHDALVGIDAAALPEPAERFRSDVAALRVVIATGADPAPPVNLLPSSIRANRESQAKIVRLAGALAASVCLVIAAWFLAGRSAARSTAEKIDIEQQLSVLQPQARERDELRQRYSLAGSQRAALRAFDSQGPRFARLLEALSRSTPDEIVLTSVAAEADGAFWNTTVSGVAITEDAALGQAGVNALLDALSTSPYVGASTQPPALRVVSGSAAGTGGGSQGKLVPEGMSGVEFIVNLRLAK